MSQVKCRGSFKAGTACGVCARCTSRNYTIADAETAREAEAKRLAKLPANRVKPNTVKVEQSSQEE